MSDLVKWQFLSLISRFIAVAAGIVQGIFVVRLLSPADYGLVGIVGSVASVIGVYQHLGLASGSTREISATKSPEQAFKVFISSLLVRLSISFPLAFGLWLSAPHIANTIYHQSLIIWPLRIQALVLLLQGTQDILGAALSGSQRFKPVLIFQAAIALISLVVYVPLIYKLHFLGYFWAMLAVAFLGVCGLLIPVWQYFSVHFSWPSRAEFKRIIRAILSVGIAIYAVKIIYTFWQRLGPLFLGTAVTAAEVGFFNFALFYATKLLTVSEAFSTINLPVMTKKFVEDADGFRQVFMTNFYKIYSFVLLAAVSAVFWAPEVVYLVVDHKYDAALPLIPPLILAFWSYGYVNLLGASVIVPAKLLWQMIGYYLVLIGGTFASFYLFRFYLDPLAAMAAATMVGGLLSLAALLIFARYYLRMTIFDRKVWTLTAILLPLVLIYFANPLLVIKVLVFCLLLFIYGFQIQRNGIFDFRKMIKWKKQFSHLTM